MDRFIERATAAQESFELSDAQLPQVIEICNRLDGIPLALELAAAQVAEGEDVDDAGEDADGEAIDETADAAGLASLSGIKTRRSSE